MGAPRPFSILVAALGGEGGGVLADWLRDVAVAARLPVQSTSIPGVAQRTGATTYYLEIHPHGAAPDRRPVFALTPTPGQVDLMVASELVEAGRAMQNGFVAANTTLIASTHRIYATVEKMPMGDGRYDGRRIVEAALQLAGRAVLFDMARAAHEAGTVISAVMFGAIAAVLEKSGALPITRAACEAAIRAGGKGVEPSLRGFAAGYAAASWPAPEAAAPAAAPAPPATPADAFPPAARAIVTEALRRTADYQDAAYAALYLDRLRRVAAVDAGDGTLTAETARHLALWMCFEDVIRVADLKTRRSRFARVREEVQAKEGEPVHIVEFLKPGLDEIAGMLPPSLAPRFHAWATRRGLAERLSIGMHVRTTSVTGFLLLRALAGLRFWRRRTARHAEEQAAIERWLAAIVAAAPNSPRLAFEIALTARLIKGYSDTHKRGRANFERIFAHLVEGGRFAGDDARADAVFAAREAALADPEGRNLDATLGRHGVAPRPPREQPIRFIKPASRA
ncbi:MAG: indolepyruvate oxidoreductase subunit beta family protein [Burkholderiales bacterium]|nr:indolepyruvate oxidoreductase subunit beta family protein [Burkholderiales bacterium]